MDSGEWWRVTRGHAPRQVRPDGTSVFYRASRDEVVAATSDRAGSTLYMVDDREAAGRRMMACVEGEGMPNRRGGRGNLFVMLNIVFPTSIDPVRRPLARPSLLQSPRLVFATRFVSVFHPSRLCPSPPAPPCVAPNQPPRTED
jgi:hypothetical protein